MVCTLPTAHPHRTYSILPPNSHDLSPVDYHIWSIPAVANTAVTNDAAEEVSIAQITVDLVRKFITKSANTVPTNIYLSNYHNVT